MKTRLMDFLCCPDCRNESLDLKIYEAEGAGSELTIRDGAITCPGCGSEFPVIRGIPRLLPLSLRRTLVSFHADYYKRHPELLRAQENTPANERVRDTLQGYSYQYHRLADPQPEPDRWRVNFLNSIPVAPDFFAGKVGADIGCGNGRHLYWAHKLGAEVLGLDLSEGVESASFHTADCHRCHVIQGDIYHLPFREGVFDFAYSIGVLHHLPDPHRGFQEVLPSLKRGGRIFFWVYGLHGMRLWYRLSHAARLRRITAFLPRWGQHGLSAILAAVLELTLWTPCRLVSALPGSGHWVGRVPLGDAYRRPFRAKVRSVFDRIQPPVTHYHEAEELRRWLAEASLQEPVVFNRDGRGWVASGIRK